MTGNVNTTIMKNLFHTTHETQESKPNRISPILLPPKLSLAVSTVVVKLVKDTSYCIITNRYNG